MSRLFTLGSIVVHAIAIAVIFVAQLVAIGPLPTPRGALFFETPRIIRIANIPLPAPRVGPSEGTGPRVSLDTGAPLAPPTGVQPESGLEGIVARPMDADATIGVVHGTGSFSSLGTTEGVPAPPPAPPTPVRLHAGIDTPQKVTQATPVYPAIARASRVQGVVILEAVIDARGNVQSATVIRSIPLLDQAALDAVRQWRFTPARLNGVAIPVVMTVTVNFSLVNQ